MYLKFQSEPLKQKKLNPVEKLAKNCFVAWQRRGKPWCKGQLEGIKSNVAALSFAVIGNCFQEADKMKPELIEIHVNLNSGLLKQSL